MIYVLCPEKSITGGPDALHQMVFYLNLLGIPAKIAYITEKKNKDVVVQKPYQIYVKDFILENNIIDSFENIVVIPELYSGKRKKYLKAKVFIWWLSVNHSLDWGFREKMFYLLTVPLRILKNRHYYKNRIAFIIRSVLDKEVYSFRNESSNISHLCASYYAYDYVSRRSQKNVAKCIEPISKLFLTMYSQDEKNICKQNRKNVILYNPVRKYNHILGRISCIAPELVFEPLQGLTQEQLIEKYKTSKLYIDFGAFPGAERIPKEAVLFGCAIITGKRGASGFYGDVPIPDDYKFGNPENQINEIVEKIRFVLNNYELVYSDFDEYRNTVLNLEANFVKCLKEIFM